MNTKLRSFASLVAVIALGACGDDRPPLPNDEEFGRLIGVGTSATGTTKAKLISVDCAYSDPPKSARTSEWMARCDYKISIVEWNSQARKDNPPFEQDDHRLVFWEENATHDGQGEWYVGY